MPRKAPKQDTLNAEKIKDYELFTIAALGPEYKPNSKTKVARDAIHNFGGRKYHHTNAEAVARRYVKKPFESYGETDNKWCWVWYSSYEELESSVLTEWRNILSQEQIAEEEAANAFYKMAEGENIELELNRYLRAKERILDIYGDFPVRVKKWKLKGPTEES